MWLNVVCGMSSFETADLLFMSERSVQRYLSLFHSTGSVAPKDSTGGPGKILTEVKQFSILQSLIYNPSAFLHEIQSQLYESTGKWIHASTICHTIHQHNFTHKKIQVIALQWSQEARIRFMAEVSPDMLIWVDGTGSDRLVIVELLLCACIKKLLVILWNQVVTESRNCDFLLTFIMDLRRE